jgi:hypothetical protein
MTDEPRDWEALRAAAITVVREHVKLSGPKAALAVDAVLAVVDEECVNRLAEQFIADTKLRSMDFTNGAQMDMEPAREAAALWVGAARGLLEGAENYAEISMEFKTAGDYQRYAFTCQKVGKLTPHEARRKAEEERDEARREVQRLLRLVRTLESDGGRIGFCVVTYNQASHWPEFDYPDLHAELQDAVNERDHKREETTKLARGERHVVAEVTELTEDVEPEVHDA